MSDRRKSRRSHSRSKSRSRSREREQRRHGNYSSSYGNSSSSSNRKGSESSKPSSSNYSSSSNNNNNNGSSSTQSQSSRSNRDSNTSSSGGSSSHQHHHGHHSSQSSQSQQQSSSSSSNRRRSNSRESGSTKSSSNHHNQSSKQSRSHRHSRSRSHSRSHSKGRSRSDSPQDAKWSKPPRDRYQNTQQQWNFKAKYDESKWLMIENLAENVTSKDIEEKFTYLSVDCGTSIYDEIKLVQYLGSAYVSYPSVSAAAKTLYHLKGKVKLRDVFYPIDFYSATGIPSTSGASVVPGGVAANSSINTGNNSSQTSKGISNISSSNSTNSSTNAAGGAQFDSQSCDWICDKCEYENFAKRQRCKICERARSATCRLVVPNNQVNAGTESSSSCLMVRGSIIQSANEQDISRAFEKVAIVKDVKLIKVKGTSQQRDFAFVEFVSVEEAEKVMSLAPSMEFKVSGQNIQVFLSRNKRPEHQSGSSTASSIQPGSTPNPFVSSVILPGSLDANQQQQLVGAQMAYAPYYAGYPGVMAQITDPSAIAAASGIVGVGQSQQQQYAQQMQLPMMGMPLHPMMQQSQQQQAIPGAYMGMHMHNMMQPVPGYPMPMPVVSPAILTSTLPNSTDPSDLQANLIKQALENAKNHSISLQQQKEDSISKQGQLNRIQQQQGDQKKKEEYEKAQQLKKEEELKSLDEQKKILEQQQKAAKEAAQARELAIAMAAAETAAALAKQTAEQRQHQQHIKFQPIGNVSHSKMEEEIPDKSQLLNNKFNDLSFELSQGSISVSNSQHISKKERMYLCSLCKRKFDSDKTIGNHYTYSKMHKENVKLFGIF